MKVMVLVKQGRGGSGVSRATRYVSRRDRDEAREGSAPRKLFSERDDRLGFFQANRALGGGEDPKAEDVLHLVISLEREDDYHQLGADEESRQQAMREASRFARKWPLSWGARPGAMVSLDDHPARNTTQFVSGHAHSSDYGREMSFER